MQRQSLIEHCQRCRREKSKILVEAETTRCFEKWAWTAVGPGQNGHCGARSSAG